MPQYTRNPPLDIPDLDPDPLKQLDKWLADAREAGMIDPTAMALGTATPDGRPSVRIVLFKGFQHGGLSFYTHLLSRKGLELEMNPFVAATFWWDRLERQVRVEGRVSRLPETVARDYFQSRPRESQLSAYTSRQSQVVGSREALDARMRDNAQKFEGQAIPFPDSWGGYSLEPESFEFWQGRLGRTHDRLSYRRCVKAWKIERLEP